MAARKLLTVFTFAKDGEFFSDSLENKDLHIAIEGYWYDNPKYHGPDIDNSIRLKRFKELVCEVHSKEILNTHSIWRSTVLEEVYKNDKHIKYNDLSECMWHPPKESNIKNVVSDEEFDRMWNQERAMEIGMLHGIDAYNDYRGY
tara:strand:+ start:139 stop:573 length:435 start_codon:yes stop_codon:yes gene_type:complete